MMWAAMPRVVRWVLCACLLPVAAGAQTAADEVEWLRKNTHDLRSVQSSKDDDYSDLHWLGQSLQGVRVVGLGEASHGDGTTFAMKARLVRYLHERLGFDVIAWESNLFDMRLMQTSICDAQITPQAAARQGIYGVWSASQQLLPLWGYLRETQATGQPVTLAGFDCRFSGGSGNGGPDAVQYLRRFFERAGQTKAEDARWAAFAQAAARLKVPANVKQPFDSSGYDAGFVGDLRTRLERVPVAFHQVWSSREIEFARQLLKSFGYLERYLREGYGKKEGGQEGAIFKRDVGMGLNLLWLVEKVYPDRKIIVWAHSGHLQNDFEPTSTDGRFRTEGLRGSSFAPVKLALGKQAYSLAFLSSEGATGSANHPEMPREAIPASHPQSLQALCRETGRPLFFLDFASLPADHWLRQPVEANFLFHAQIFNTPAETVRNWTERFDGMIYIRTMEPSLPAHTGP